MEKTILKILFERNKNIPLRYKTNTVFITSGKVCFIIERENITANDS